MSLNYGWVFILLTAFLVALTSLQARGSVMTRSSPVISQSRAISILFLRAFSELAALALGATISVALKQLRWAMVCWRRPQAPASFLDFLALQQDTTTVGLLALVTSSHVASKRTRLWSLLRLMLMVLIPATGVVIMSQVDIHLAFTLIPSAEQKLGFGNWPMNATAASEYTGFSDLILSWKFSGFLSDSAHSIDLTPPGDQGKTCSLDSTAEDSIECRRRYFIPGEIVFAAPDLVSDPSHPETDIILLSDHQGYLLEFNAGDSKAEIDSSDNCRTYSSRYFGFQAGALRLCVWNSGPSELQTRLVTCPGELASQFACLNDTSWHHNLDWTAKVSVAFQNASVAYSRSNETIIWSSLSEDPPIPVIVNASQILEAYDRLLLDTTTLLHQNGTDLPLFSGSSFPTFLWLLEPEFNGENKVNRATSSGTYSVLQSLLAMPLYYCQNGVARRLITGIAQSKSASNPELSALIGLLSPLPPQTSKGSFAYYRYEIVASMTTMIVYLTLNGIALLFCIAAQIFVTLAARRSLGGSLPPLTEFPTLDLLTNCSIEDEKRCVVYQGRSGSMLYISSRNNMMGWLSTLRVKCARLPRDEEGIQLFSWQEAGGPTEGYSGDNLSLPGGRLMWPQSHQPSGTIR